MEVEEISKVLVKLRGRPSDFSVDLDERKGLESSILYKGVISACFTEKSLETDEFEVFFDEVTEGKNRLGRKSFQKFLV